MVSLVVLEELRGRRGVVHEVLALRAADAHLELVLGDGLRVEDGPVELAVGFGELFELIREGDELRARLFELALERADLLALGDLDGGGHELRHHADAHSGEHERERGHGADLEPEPLPARLDLHKRAGLVVVVVEAVGHGVGLAQRERGPPSSGSGEGPAGPEGGGCQRLPQDKGRARGHGSSAMRARDARTSGSRVVVALSRGHESIRDSLRCQRRAAPPSIPLLTVPFCSPHGTL